MCSVCDRCGKERIIAATRSDMLWVDGKAVTLEPGAADTLAGGTVRALTAESYTVTETTGEVVCWVTKEVAARSGNPRGGPSAGRTGRRAGAEGGSARLAPG